MSILRSIAFYALFYGGTLFLVMTAALTLLVGGRGLVPIVRAWVRWHRWCVTALLGIKVEVEGTLPDQPALYAARHESFFEAIDMPHFLPFAVVFAKEELFRIPGWGKAAKKYGLIPVARDKGAAGLRAMLAAAKLAMAQRRPIVIFPEGTRMMHGKPGPLGSGFAGLYKMLGLPVVPIAIDSGPLYHRRWKRSGTITYRVGEMIPPGLPRAEVEMRVLAGINALNPPEPVNSADRET